VSGHEPTSALLRKPVWVQAGRAPGIETRGVWRALHPARVRRTSRRGEPCQWPWWARASST